MIKTLGMVLHKQNLGETDRILTLFSPTLGKRRVVAKAVRKPLSKLAGHVDTFMISQYIITDDAELPVITSAVVVEPFERMRGSLAALYRAFAVSRIVERVILENLPQQRLFQLSMDAFVRVNETEPWPAAWLYFLYELTSQLGVALPELSCERCQKPIREDGYWQPEERQFFCASCAQQLTFTLVKLETNTIKLLHLLRRKPYSAIRTIAIPPAIARQTEELFLRELAQWLRDSWQEYTGLTR